jgi:hypothetical protein
MLPTDIPINMLPRDNKVLLDEGLIVAEVESLGKVYNVSSNDNRLPYSFLSAKAYYRHLAGTLLPNKKLIDENIILLKQLWRWRYNGIKT